MEGNKAELQELIEKYNQTVDPLVEHYAAGRQNAYKAAHLFMRLGPTSPQEPCLRDSIIGPSKLQIGSLTHKLRAMQQDLAYSNLRLSSPRTMLVLLCCCYHHEHR